MMMKRVVVSGVLVLALASLVAGEARADEQGLSAENLLLKANNKNPRGKMVFLSKDAAIEGPSSPEDAYFEICSPAEPEKALFNLPAFPWKVNKKGVATYREGGGAVVARVLIKPAKTLKIVGHLASTEALGSVGVRLTIGDHTQCALFTGAAVVKNEPKHFQGKGAPAPADCSDATLGCFGTAPPIRPFVNGLAKDLVDRAHWTSRLY